MPRRTLLLAAATTTAAVTALTGCSSGGHTAPGTTAVTPSAHAIASNVKTTAACGALPDFDTAQLAYPGADPDGPAPTAAQLTTWATRTALPLTTLASNLPVDLGRYVSTLRAGADAADRGTPLTPDDPARGAAVAALDRWGHDHCGFTPLDVTDSGADLTGVPATLRSGPASVSFTNHAQGQQAGFILLIARVRPGATYTLAQIRANTVDLASVADIVAAVQPGPVGVATYATATLTAGHYILSSPVGTPPKFTRILARELDVR